MLDGINFEERKYFIDWATELLPCLNRVMKDVNKGIGDDIIEVKNRQIKLSSYLARLVGGYHFEVDLMEGKNDQSY
jgi:hypothetical protein